MKQHTQDFKNEICLVGKQQEIKIEYGSTTLTSEQVNSVTSSYEGNLLKSIMKCLEIDSNENIPEGTEIAFKYGLWVNGAYEYIDFGKYIVKETEKQEDTNSYLITCYDKLLYSMKDYEKINVTYPISVKNYLKAICNHLGLTFKDSSFANGNKMIPNELYLAEDGNSLDYTFRDVLDEIAQVSGGVICINSNNELEVRYINDTSDTIDEEYLKDVNVNFGKKYGPINSIVLSRAGESDNVYLKDETSITQNGLCELKISENQIMNFNDRSDYLQELFEKIKGVEYYLNDFTSTGIVYYDLLDKYNVKIGDNTYNCLMLNDEVNITQGLEEIVHTDMPETSETDYTKSDKTDRKVNQTYIIANKQEGKITALSSSVEEIEKDLILTKTTDEAKEFYITDTADNYCKSVEIFGESTQDTREGTNLFDASKISNTNIVVSDSGKTITMPVATSGNGITYTGNLLKELCPNLKVGDVATLEFDRNLIEYNGYIYLDAPASYLWNKGTKNAITITENMLNAPVNLYGNRYSEGETKQIILSNFRINLGTELKEWEPYGAMPSPEFPSDIESVSGKNLIDISKATNEWINPSGNIGTSLVTKTTDYIPVKANQSYVFSYNYDTLANSSAKGICFYNTNKEVITGGWNYDPTLKKIVITPMVDCYVRFSYDSNAYDVQLEKGSTPTFYVPYNHIAFKSTGKNLVDLTPLTEDKINSSSGASVSEFVYDETLNRNVYHMARTTTASPTYPQTTFKLPVDKLDLTNKNLAIVYRYRTIGDFSKSTAKGGWIGFNGRNYWEILGIGNSTLTKDLFINTSEQWAIGCTRISKDNTDCEKYGKNVQYMDICLGINGDLEIFVSDIMAIEITDEEYNSDTYTPPEFEPYKEPSITTIPLLHDMRSLPNGTRDRIYYSNGKWYDEQNIGQIVFNGSESWSGYRGESDSYTHRVFIHTLQGIVIRSSIISNHFTINYQAVTAANANGIYSLETNYIYISIDKTLLTDTTPAAFKTWLSENNTEAIYELAEPITTEITDEATITALESIRTFKGTTIITADASNILTYYRNVPFNDQYETKQNASKNYRAINTQYSELIIEQDSIKSTVSDVKSMVDEQGTLIEDIESDVSKVEQTAEQISSEVSKKVGENEVISKINQSAEQVQIDANKISLKRKNNRLNI